MGLINPIERDVKTLYTSTYRGKLNIEIPQPAPNILKFTIDPLIEALKTGNDIIVDENTNFIFTSTETQYPQGIQDDMILSFPDNGVTIYRTEIPDTITIQLYRDAALVRTVIANRDEIGRFSYEGPTDGQWAQQVTDGMRALAMATPFEE